MGWRGALNAHAGTKPYVRGLPDVFWSTMVVLLLL